MLGTQVHTSTPPRRMARMEGGGGPGRAGGGGVATSDTARAGHAGAQQQQQQRGGAMRGVERNEGEKEQKVQEGSNTQLQSDLDARNTDAGFQPPGSGAARQTSHTRQATHTHTRQPLLHSSAHSIRDAAVSPFSQTPQAQAQTQTQTQPQYIQRPPALLSPRPSYPAPPPPPQQHYAQHPHAHPHLQQLRDDDCSTTEPTSRHSTPHPPGFMHHQQQSSDATTTQPERHGQLTPPSMASSDDIAGGGDAAHASHLDDSVAKLSASTFSHASSSASGVSPHLPAQQQLPPTYSSDYAPEPGNAHPPRAFSEASGAASASAYPPPTRARTRRKKKPAPPELLVIVRPPPSKDRNPLNLQIQLVVPQLPAPTRTSTESSRDSASVVNSTSGGTIASQLQRRGSTSSSRSGRSEMTNASTASSQSNRRVTPLYNLAFHSILPTTVSDAGTDQRVAKYSKRGVDLDGFGLLEPRELVYGLNDVATLEASASGFHSVAGSAAGLAASPRIGGHESVDGSILSPRPPGSDPGVEPPASAFEPPTSFEAMTPEARSPESGVGTKFMRRFKGLSFNGPKTPSSSQSTAFNGTEHGGAPTSAASITSFLSGLGRTPKASTFADRDRPPTSAGPASAVSAAAAGPSSATLLSTPTTGPASAAAASRIHYNYGTDIAALAPAAGITEGGRRTQGYFWTVRKYTRRVADENGNMPQVPLGPDGQNPVLKNVWKRFNTVNRMGGEERHPHPSTITVRFEWTREGRSTSASVARTSDVAGPSASASTGSGVNAGAGAGLLARSSTLSDAARKRLSGISIGSGVGPGAGNGASAMNPASSSRRARASLRPPTTDRRVSASRSSSRPGYAHDAEGAATASPRQSTDASTHGSIAPSDDGHANANANGGDAAGVGVVRGRNGRVVHPNSQGQDADRADSEVSAPSAPGPTASTSASASAVDDGASDSGNASDPEDSETPWSCHLVLGAATRIPIGTLSPAPHHPKVVAQLAVPFPLPDLSQTGLGSDAAGLTREEIKDVICVSCLHLVVRESFGGLGRVRRKGDRC